MLLRLYRTPAGAVVERDGRHHALAEGWDELVSDEALGERLASTRGPEVEAPTALLPPVEGQEVWAAGVTYWRSRDARREESARSGAAAFYDRVYEAPRPELFFKATPHRVVGPGGKLRLRRDSSWMVPEPELALLVSPGGVITGYTIGNDLSCRDIEGDNPLYLPQAKTFDACAALGPCVLVGAPLPTEIVLSIVREGAVVFSGSAGTDQLRRRPEELVQWLFREASFPAGCFLLTGTGIVPPDHFTLQPGDRIEISIDPIGTLINHV
jgi:2-dehydro-3-deoxy-D-arabinonate dehydratase